LPLSSGHDGVALFVNSVQPVFTHARAAALDDELLAELVLLNSLSDE